MREQGAWQEGGGTGGRKGIVSVAWSVSLESGFA